MNTTLLNAVDALINDDEDSSVDFLKQAMVDKIRQRMGLNESLIDESIDDDDSLNESVSLFSHALQYNKMLKDKR